MNCTFKMEYFCQILGICFLFIVVFKYAEYLEMLHENEMWFTNIKEVEREISFRTEQGLYYSYYKQLVYAPTITEGIKSLMIDNRTEYGHVINVFKRFNIFQEVIVAVVYRSLSSIIHLKPIFFYIKFVFFLNGLGLGLYFLTSWYMSQSLLAGVLTVLFYVVNKIDATRVYYTIPLRESFALPLLSGQTLAFVMFLRPSSKVQKVEKWNLFLLLISTFLFTCTWQFAQFVLLFQAVVLYVLTLSGLLPVQKVLYCFYIFLISLLSVICLQFGQKMLLCSFVLSFIPVVILILYIKRKDLSRAKFAFIFSLMVQLLSTLICAYLLNCILKFLIGNEDDSHIMTYLKARIFQVEAQDFVTKLYLCNPGFNFIDKEIFWRLSETYILPLYCFHLIYFVIFILTLLGYKSQNQRETPKFFIVICNDWLVCRPDVVYVTGVSIFFGILALFTLRMKYLWLPYMCLLSPLILTDLKLWRCIPFSFLKIFLPSILIGLIAALAYRFDITMKAESLDFSEFWDPDTVNLMEWVKKETPPTAVFSGSMQLLAGVKLCTSRSITNHPHFENKWLRERTKEVYKIYARQTPEAVYDALHKIGSTHIILEDSLCLSSRTNNCSLPQIMDNHFNSGTQEHYNIPSFCDEVRHMKPPYSKFFKQVYYNKTFRVYQLL